MSPSRAPRNSSTAFVRALGAAVRARRVQLGLRRTAVARRIGLAETAIVAIEEGEADLDLILLARLAEVLELPLRTLLRRMERQIGWTRKNGEGAKRPKRTHQKRT